MTDHNDAADDEDAHLGERDTRLPPVRGSIAAPQRPAFFVGEHRSPTPPAMLRIACGVRQVATTPQRSLDKACSPAPSLQALQRRNDTLAGLLGHPRTYRPNLAKFRW